MKTITEIRALLIFCLITFCFPVEVNAQEKKYTFHYEDIENFRIAYEAIQSGSDAVEEIRKYFGKASPGMKGWLDIYGLKPERLAKEVVNRPKFYKNLLHTDKEIRKYEKTISEAYTRLLEFPPLKGQTILPTYYFILWSGGGSVRPAGSMISVDYFGLSDTIDPSEFPEGIFPKGRIPLVSLKNIPHVSLHEMVHWFQRHFQGLDNYVSIYRNKEQSTLLAYAIREGGAEMITRVLTELEDTKRNDFGRKHEQEIWEAFKPDMFKNVDEARGWFSGAFPDKREWPFQIGYYMGLEITQYYYEQARDKEAALEEIFNAYKPEQFRKFIDVYSKKFED
ncbi:hypothetical protein GWK08_06165 [Leptobacterium flavescens]|uniref:DUF2268 domain-containing protein n=1 Tax=Leptobacterium flavescens TaxID=472055 RepID=A0A6P0UI93_9FLAO|nr:hypothetical protein [Leptobacterium flavescens]NER13015.1 hypothetical protein [Leptobacterium flavescens]